MSFTGVLFLFRFLPILMFMFYVAPGWMKNGILFLGSLLFYAWGQPEYCVLMIGCGAIDFLLGLWLERARRGMRTFILCLSVLMNVGTITFFKFGDSIAVLSNRLLHTELPILGLPFPTGVMIYSLLSLSYVIDVYRRENKAVKNPLLYLSYISLFPLAFVGPVVGYKELEGQLTHLKPILSEVSGGLKRICVGLAKKVILADNLILLWQTIAVSDIRSMSMLSAWMGIISFGLAVYFSLSGYSDIAIGLGKMLGLSFGENFRQPYAAASVSDFCRRWHISLQEWIKNNCRSLFRADTKGFAAGFLATMLTGALVGCWYGTGLHFLIWGLWIAFFVMLEKGFLGEFLEKKVPLIGRLYTLAVVMVGWVIFALPDFTEMFEYLTALIRVNRIVDGQFLYWSRGNFILLILSVIMASPLCAAVDNKLKTSATGYGMALYRLSEKVIPAILLLLAIAELVGSGEIPVLFWN